MTSLMQFIEDTATQIPSLAASFFDMPENGPTRITTDAMILVFIFLY